MDGAAVFDTSLSRFAGMLAEAESVSGKNDKRAIIARYLNAEGGEKLARFCELALSPYVRFYVQQLPEPSVRQALPAHQRDAGALMLLDLLSQRQATGGKAQELIAALMSALPDDHPQPVSEREAFRRILLKDLRIGVAENTINKARPGTVPVFECQLAPSEQPDIDTLTYPIAAEPKWDGVRTIAVKRNGVVTLFSRNGIPFDNFAEIEEYLTLEAPDNFVLDGEVLHRTLLGPEGYKQVMKRARADRGKHATIPIRFSAYDIMPLSAWDAKSFTTSYKLRREILERCHGDMPQTDIFQLTEVDIAADAGELRDIYARRCRQGFEGLIVKPLDGVYAFKRDANWMKLKPMETIDLKIVGMTEGAGKLTGTMGTLVCEGEFEGKKILTEVGTGFDDGLRAAFWSNQAGEVGTWIEVKYQDVTQAEGSGTHSLRFPVFVRRRIADKSGAKA